MVREDCLRELDGDLEQHILETLIDMRQPPQHKWSLVKPNSSGY